jgi:hypothetical protein
MDAVDEKSMNWFRAAAQMVMDEQKEEFERIITLIKSHIKTTRIQ